MIRMDDIEPPFGEHHHDGGKGFLERMMPRYKMISGSDHSCCFTASVVDTERTMHDGDGMPTDRFETVCECFNEGTPMQIADALNKGEL